MEMAINGPEMYQGQGENRMFIECFQDVLKWQKYNSPNTCVWRSSC